MQCRLERMPAIEAGPQRDVPLVKVILRLAFRFVLSGQPYLTPTYLGHPLVPTIESKIEERERERKRRNDNTLHIPQTKTLSLHPIQTRSFRTTQSANIKFRRQRTTNTRNPQLCVRRDRSSSRNSSRNSSKPSAGPIQGREEQGTGE